MSLLRALLHDNLSTPESRAAQAAERAKTRVTKRGRKRGMNHLSLTLETGGVMMWFVFMMTGEKLVGDATAARRTVTNTTQQSARVSGAGYCQGGGSGSGSGGFSATANLNMGQEGIPDIGSFMSIISMLGFGSQQTMQLFSMPFKSATASANVENVKAAKLLGGDSYSFQSQASAACREKGLDKPGTSITDYRNSVFMTNIQGWSQ